MSKENESYGEIVEEKIKKVNKTSNMKEYMKEYHKKYYPNNKHRYGKKPKKKKIDPVVIENRYNLKINNDKGTQLISIDYRSQKDIAIALCIPEHTVSRIYLGKYKHKRINLDDRLKNYTITKI